MLIRELGKHFPARAPEWFDSGMMASWGLYVLLHPEIFLKESFGGLASLTWPGASPPLFWGFLALAVGLTHAVALFVNGAYRRTPLIRLATSMVSAYVWSQIVIGFWHSDRPNTGIVTYSWLVLMDAVSAYRASQDIVIAGSLTGLTTKGDRSGGRFDNIASRLF